MPTVNEIFQAVVQKTLKEKSSDELSVMAQACRNCVAAGHYGQVAIDALAQIDAELRTRDRDVQHAALIAEQQKIQASLETLIGRTGKHHWTLTPTFWVGVAVLIVAIATLIVAILK